MNTRSKMKKDGRDAAWQWLQSADPAEIVRVAGYDFDYQWDNLTALKEQGFQVPSNTDYDYSWGFFKQVKGHVTHRIWSRQ